MDDTKLDKPSSDVKDALSAASELLAETAVLLEGIPDAIKDSRPAMYRATTAAISGLAVIAVTDPKVTPKAQADELQARARVLHDNVAAAAATGGGSINDPAEAMLSALMAVRQDGSPTKEQAKLAARRLVQSLSPQIRTLDNEARSLEEQISDLDKSVAAQAEAAHEIRESIEKRLESTSERVDELISDQDSKFTAAQDKRREEHAETLSEASHRLAEASKKFEERRDAAVERLDQIENEVAKTAAAIGGRATAAGYGEEAEEQRVRAFRWSIATIVLLIAAAVVPAALGVLKANQSAESVSGKITIALIIAGAAGYAGNLAHHHQRRAAKARRLEIEMSAFGPFVATLDQNEQNELRSMIVWRFFGAEDDDDGGGPPVGKMAAIRGLVQRDRDTGKNGQGSGANRLT